MTIEEAAELVDARIDERDEDDGTSLLDDLRAFDRPLTLEEAATYIRAAYGLGYTDAIRDDLPMTEEVPVLRYPELFLERPC